MYTTLIKRFISNLFNLNSLIFNLFSFHAAPPLGILFSLIFLLIPACKKDLSPVKDRQIEIKLTVESAEVTEAWLKLETSPLESEDVYIVKRDTHFVFNGKLDKSDTLLHDENLQPAHDYNYSAYAVLNGKTGKIVKVSVTTMDTTRHDFEWEVFEWGYHSSSCLFDVAIINENDIWAVGEIYTEDTYTYDSLGNWIEPYNAVHWDGEKWELKRILYKGGFWDIHTVFAFNENDIWFEAFVKWNGIKFIQMPIPDILIGYGINKTWGTSDSDLYIVGNNGLIAHYDGQSWQKIESGTDLPIRDIRGSIDPETGDIFILCPACLKFEAAEPKLLCINSDYSVSEENWPYPNNDTYSVWFKGKDNVFICGGGAYKRDFQGKYTRFTQLPKIFMNRIRGNDINDIFVAGDFGLLAHYNGQTWREYTVFNEVDLFWSLDYKDDIAVAVGEKNSKAVIYMIRRN